ncbi:deoxyribose-phosphate aldolase [Aestuariimicrobium sp. p3-SID1156]|uniref:deoxyribose-phosphate aldolase n=1 Tax=Aestuariimicrobium sp. p3-SID1156 TaxID=2916038 RepID=UPI00223C057F|nr:deoxyribose-phosphate aldolase [Aestuariimicrobium sp. p3-SID1156]MCT1459770.1 deoxyribose-phosphate aldolase [Aestuariimicrobium sp. p3-SID1156]
MDLTPTTLAGMIDHTLLKPDATLEQFDRLCQEAKSYGFATVAINPYPVAHCARALDGSGVKVGAAISFPLGQTTIEDKVTETRQAISCGAGEIDYVVNITALKAGHDDYVRQEMQRILELCREHSVTCKVIFENCYLTDDEKRRLAEIAVEVRPDFIKTSTGFGPSGATLADVELMRNVVGDSVQIKAAGGIRTLDDVRAYLDLGVTRIGTSAGIRLVEQLRA